MQRYAKNSTIGTAFTTVLKNKNILTPRILGFYNPSHYTVELSEGTGFDNEPIFGVSVVDLDTQEHNHGLSKMCTTKPEALTYIKSLNKL